MAAAWIALPGTVCLGLIVMLWRRLISPMRFAQAVGGVALGTLMAIGLAQAAGGGHG